MGRCWHQGKSECGEIGESRGARYRAELLGEVGLRDDIVSDGMMWWMV